MAQLVAEKSDALPASATGLTARVVLLCVCLWRKKKKKTDFTDQSDFDWLHIRLSGLAMCRGNP
jgi:hypothetical protein